MNESTNVKVETNNGLMKKTKAQLVEIILRKDDVEKNLREEIKIKEKEVIDIIAAKNKFSDSFDKLNDKYEELRVKHNNLRRDYEIECDDYTTLEFESYKKIKTYKVISIVAIAITIIALVFNFIH